MLFTLSVTYLIVSLVVAVIFYSACAVGARADRDQNAENHRDYRELDQRDLEFQFNHLEWAEKANG